MVERHDFASTDTTMARSPETRRLSPGPVAVPQVQLRREPLFKRPLDITLAILGLILSSPLWLIVALAIKLHGDGSVFYRQERWGRAGHRFTLYKFRTMVEHSDAHYGIKQAKEDDHRITAVGRILRATGMDELPQFLNILRGNMSFVGPRALAIGEVLHTDGSEPAPYEDSEHFFTRLMVRPGLTGTATVYLPRDANPAAKFEQDLRYIEHQSFWLDLKLIALSLWISVRGKWESREKKY